jgi:LPXTG-motif cell wall-anchored protein
MIFAWQGEGHAWDYGCTPGTDNRHPCDQGQTVETLIFVLNGTEVGRFVDHAPEDDQSYFYSFPITLAQGDNQLLINTPDDGNSVFVKGTIFAQPAAPPPGTTPEPSPTPEIPPPAATCEDTKFVVEGRVLNSCGAEKPVLEITRLYQPTFKGLSRKDSIPRDASGQPLLIDDAHWIDAVVPSIAGWSREAVVEALQSRAQAEGQPENYYLQNPDKVTWRFLIANFGADRIEGFYVHIADRDDNCGALAGNQGGTDQQRVSRWVLIQGTAQFEPTCPTPVEGTTPDTTPVEQTTPTTPVEGTTPDTTPGDGATGSIGDQGDTGDEGGTASDTGARQDERRTPVAGGLGDIPQAAIPQVGAEIADRQLEGDRSRSDNLVIPLRLPDTGGETGVEWLLLAGVVSSAAGLALRRAIPGRRK